MDILDVLSEMEELVEESTRVPLVGKIMIDDELILDMVDHIRNALPEEMRQAKAIVQEHEKILEDAKRQAEQILAQAKDELTRMTGENELVKQARQQASQMLEQAKALSREIKVGAYEYADDLLNTSEQTVEKLLAKIKDARTELRTPPPGEQQAAATK